MLQVLIPTYYHLLAKEWMILWVFQLFLKHSCEQKNDPCIPSFRQLGHCSLAGKLQPGDSQVPKFAIIPKFQFSFTRTQECVFL